MISNGVNLNPGAEFKSIPKIDLDDTVYHVQSEEYKY